MPELLRISVLLLLITNSAYLANAHSAQSDVETSRSPSSRTESAALSTPLIGRTAAYNATCPSRTANYITHTLPQQCLRTDRASVNVTDTPTITSVTDAALSTPASVVSQDDNPVDEQVTTSALSRNSAIGTGTEPELEITSKGTPAASHHSAETPPAAVQEAEAETDSPLDNANFLSFEDWKRQNLVKAGQSPDNIGVRSQALDGERKRPGINNALDTLGEESEIELDFSGFGASHDNSDHERSSPSASESEDARSSLDLRTTRSKDAGKTCKERTNYASFDCAATILKNNPESKSGSSVLVENKDSYMLNKCSANNKFLIVELCNDILVDTIVLANYEFFSSIFRHFRISVSDRYPVKLEKWKELGTFEARNTREVQAFLVENPLIWARYLRIEFLTHYGNEYYCPVSLLRVHGTTMMDEFRHQEEIARGEPQDDEVVVEPDVPAQTTIQQEPLTASPEAEQSTVEAITSSKSQTNIVLPSPHTGTAFAKDHDTSYRSLGHNDSDPLVQSNQSRSFNRLTLDYPSCRIDEKPLNSKSATASTATANKSNSSESSISRSSNTTTEPRESATAATSTEILKQDVQQPDVSMLSENTTVGTGGRVETSNNSTTTGRRSASNTSSTIIAPPTSRSREEVASTAQSKASSPTGNLTRPAPSSTSAHPAQPSTQESFFKSVHKRLQQLESNSTLSLQYIEEQSRILRDAFSKVEKRQLSSTTNFLSHLNSTVMNELQGFRQSYDQLWQSTVIELENQREQYQREMLALSTRLTLVADELVWQKRMGIVQSTLLLLCLALVLFNRNGNSALVEMPLLQQMMNKSQAALRSGWESPTGSRSPEDRSPEGRSPVSLFRKKLWRHSTDPASGHGTDATDSRPQSRDAANGGLDVNLRPPTPPDPGSDSEDEGEWKEVPEIQSGPATPRGTREALGSPAWVDEDIIRTSSLLE